MTPGRSGLLEGREFPPDAPADQRLFAVMPLTGTADNRCLRVYGGFTIVRAVAFQKKAKQDIATPKQEIDLVRRRLEAARKHYDRNYGGG